MPDAVAAMGAVRVWFPRLTSTMDVAMALASAGAPHGTLVEAAEQTAGRGRLGRRWVAPAGSAFLGSWLLRAPAGMALTALSPAVAAAVLRAVAALLPAAPVGFKWPNDVQVEGRKVAGILLTSRVTPPGAIVIAGTGINVDPASVPAGIDATCLADWGDVTVAAVRRAIGVELDRAWRGVLASGGLPERDRSLLEARMAWLGERIEVVMPDGPVAGIAAGLAADGGLRLRGQDGRSERVLHVGEIVRGPRRSRRARGDSAVYLPEHDRC